MGLLLDEESERRDQDGQQGASFYAAPVGVVMMRGISIVGLRGIQRHNSLPHTLVLGSDRRATRVEKWRESERDQMMSAQGCRERSAIQTA